VTGKISPEGAAPITFAILLGSAIIALSIVWASHTTRYQIAQAADGVVFRLDRSSGVVDVCQYRREVRDTLVVAVATCNGRMR
jgi:hypothetical protein